MNNEKENVKDDVEPNTETSTVDFETWKTNLDICPPYDFDENDMNYIQEKLNIKGYMNAPVALYEGKILMAKYVACESLDEIIENFKDKEIFLYQLLSCSVDWNNSGDFKSYLKLRYATLEN